MNAHVSDAGRALAGAQVNAPGKPPLRKTRVPARGGALGACPHGIQPFCPSSHDVSLQAAASPAP